MRCEWMVLALVIAVSSGAVAETELAQKVLELTGSRTKIAWTRGYRDNGGALMGFDTADGKERVIVPAPEVCYVPWFTPDGERIVYSGPPGSRSAYVVDWDGQNRKCIMQGRYFFVLGVWRDPATKFDWVYVSDATSAEADAELVAKGSAVTNHTGIAVQRFRLDDPSVREPVWDKAYTGVRTTISSDGKYLVGEFPWPNCGIADIAARTWKMVAQGCNANLAPDGSGLFFNLIGDHRTVTMYDSKGIQKAKFAINTMPGNEKDPSRAVWRPRWSNNIRFMTVQSADLGVDADIVIGRFNAEFTGIDSWVRIADSKDYDGNAIAWIKPVTPLGEKLTDNLEAPLLGNAIVQLEKAVQVKPVFDQLEKLAANKENGQRASAAQDVLDHVRRWADSELKKTKALESEDPVAAGRAYKQLAYRFSGLDSGAEAAARLKDPALIKEAKAWQYLLKVEKAVKALQDVPGAEAKATDKAWLAKNSLRVAEIRSAAKQAAQGCEGTLAQARIQSILDQYGIEVR